MPKAASWRSGFLYFTRSDFIILGRNNLDFWEYLDFLVSGTMYTKQL